MKLDKTSYHMVNRYANYFILLAICVLIGSCARRKQPAPVSEQTLKQIVDTIIAPAFKAPIHQQDLSPYYNAPEFLEDYKAPVQAPPFNFNVNCSGKSLVELRCLRNEIYARHGYLFRDAILRGYFNQNKWYQPIYWDSSFTVELNLQEKWFVNKVKRFEDQLQEQNYLVQNNRKLANINNVVNFIQFEGLPDILIKRLKVCGYAIVPAEHDQLYHLYDKNNYQYIPSFVTTDLYLQLMHLHYSNLMKKLELKRLYQSYCTMLAALHQRSIAAVRAAPNSTVRDAAEFSTAYYAIGLSLLSQEEPLDSEEPFATTVEVTESYHSMVAEELEKIRVANSMGSEFLGFKLFDYTQLQPRGHYTGNDSLQMYFRAVKWLMTAPFIISEDKGLNAAICAGYFLRASGEDEYHQIEKTLNFLVGDPDNLSLVDVVDILNRKYPKMPLASLLEKKTADAIRSDLYATDPQRISPRAASKDAAREFSKKRLFFMAGRYTFDAEILQRLVNVQCPEIKRPFPKGLDVFATLRLGPAESLLVHTYQEVHHWPAYADSLKMLQKKEEAFTSWNATSYNKRMDVIRSLFHSDPRCPYFMKLPEWDFKTLTTALASWTQLKHEVILYAKQPFAAECGEGGGPPPPEHIGYVEPNLMFWQRCTELIDLTSKTFRDNKMETEDFVELQEELRGLAEFLRSVSEKELSEQRLTKEEYDQIAWIGGRVENISEKIRGPYLAEEDPERSTALVADVYTFNTDCLEEAVGKVDEIYVVVEIDGLLYLTRGGVLSYYEFTQPTSNRLTDLQWQDVLKDKNGPARPVWINDVLVPIKPLKTKPFYSNL